MNLRPPSATSSDAARGTAVTRPVQPECTGCGMTDLNFVWAAAAGWRVVLGRLRCRLCASGFPAWMHRSF